MLLDIYRIFCPYQSAHQRVFFFDGWTAGLHIILLRVHHASNHADSLQLYTASRNMAHGYIGILPMGTRVPVSMQDKTSRRSSAVHPPWLPLTVAKSIMPAQVHAAEYRREALSEGSPLAPRGGAWPLLRVPQARFMMGAI